MLTLYKYYTGTTRHNIAEITLINNSFVIPVDIKKDTTFFVECKVRACGTPAQIEAFSQILWDEHLRPSTYCVKLVHSGYEIRMSGHFMTPASGYTKFYHSFTADKDIHQLSIVSNLPEDFDISILDLRITYS